MDIAAHFWEDERYKAAQQCYQSMRVIDDLVDKRKSSKLGITKDEKQVLITKITQRINSLTKGIPQNTFDQQLLRTIQRFQLPLWPWQQFSRAMLFDIHHHEFKTFPIFLEYTEGASVAPASIFIHLCGIVKENGTYKAPEFDVRQIAKSAGLFCYLVHIIRDFQIDQNNNLNYFACDLITKNGLSQSTLKKIAKGKTVTLGFRKLMKKYYYYAEYYRCKTLQSINKIRRYLKPQYQLSLEIVYSLYYLIFKRIDLEKGSFTTEELTPSQKEIEKQIRWTITDFNLNRNDL